MLTSCVATTNATAEFGWVSDEPLLRLGVRQWSELPLWRTHAGVWNVDASRAIGTGLECRSLEHTIRDTWAWMQEDPESPDDQRASEIGLTQEREAMILGAV